MFILTISSHNDGYITTLHNHLCVLISESRNDGNTTTLHFSPIPDLDSIALVST